MPFSSSALRSKREDELTTPKRDLEDDALDEEEELIQSGRGAKDLEFDCRGVEHDTCKSRVEV